MAERSSGIPVKRKTSSSSSSTSPATTNSPIHNKKLDTQMTHLSPDSKLDNQRHDMEKDAKNKNNKAREAGHSHGISSIYADTNCSLLYYTLLLFMTTLSFVTRFYNIEIPSWICWDETHFGKMGSWYIKQSFFFDVHPPLGKMLIGLSGYLTGYDGLFPFDKPGDEYGETKYVGMRMFCATLGALLVPLSYMSTWLLCKSVTAALFASSLVLFETGVNTLSRHILLDPILMFFIMAATYCLLKFLSYRDRSFSLQWWLWLFYTGVFLACSIGVKFVGLFVILLAGFSTIEDLWRLLGEQSYSMVDILKHFLARAMCLIVVPIICYFLLFAIHFNVLTQSGNGDGFYSSQFQSQLEGNRLHNVSMPDKLAYGSLFSLKQRRTGGGYLHSHWHLYPEEHPPRQQQVTTYSHKDENNMWRIKPAVEEPDIEGYPILVKNGDLVRLEHVVTRRLLHSHKEPAPITHRHYQLSGYGQDGKGDANDVWQIDIPGAEAGAPVLAVRSKLQVIHYHVRCAIHSHDKKLPKWGWEQLEATCNPNVKDPKTLWSIEEVVDPRLPNVSFEVHAPSMLEKFIESHAVMTQGNSGLKPKEGEVTSRPWEWPINLRGQIFSGKDHKIYLLGNPIIFYLVLSMKLLFFCLYGVFAVTRQRGAKMRDDIREFNERMFTACWWLLIGWSLHYLPFWPMTRVLYFHHYFPAFLYSAMMAGVVIDYIIKRLCLMVPSSLHTVLFHLCVGTVLSIIAYSFYLFHPLTYGMSGPGATEEGSMMYGLKWLDSWEI